MRVQVSLVLVRRQFGLIIRAFVDRVSDRGRVRASAGAVQSGPKSLSKLPPCRLRHPRERTLIPEFFGEPFPRRLVKHCNQKQQSRRR
jgi:hypothetical protein